jgi:hypothetical protein
MTTFFGVLHQGGTIPAMLDVQKMLQHTVTPDVPSTVQAFFWRSFMPPRHLLSSTSNGVTVQDCQSIPVEQLTQAISVDSSERKILFGPSWALNEDVKAFLLKQGFALTPLTKHFLHLDADHLGESISEYQRGQTLFQSFSYAAWNIDPVSGAMMKEKMN